MTGDPPEIIAANAAHDSSEQTLDALDEATQLNDDPEVAEALSQATLQATNTASRLGWLRSRLRQWFSKPD